VATGVPSALAAAAIKPGAAPYGSQGADFDFLLARLLVFDPSLLFLGSSAPHQLQ